MRLLAGYAKLGIDCVAVDHLVAVGFFDLDLQLRFGHPASGGTHGLFPKE